MSIENFDPMKVGKNQKKFGYINVVDNVAARYNMPIGVVNGAKEGPTFLVTGGLYPTEYYGLESASRLYQEIDPEKLSGRFIAIPCINMYALQFRGPMKLYSTGRNPTDMLSLNQSFPGDENGKPSQVNTKRVNDILQKSDYHIDFEEVT